MANSTENRRQAQLTLPSGSWSSIEAIKVFVVCNVWNVPSISTRFAIQQPPERHKSAIYRVRQYGKGSCRSPYPLSITSKRRRSRTETNLTMENVYTLQYDSLMKIDKCQHDLQRRFGATHIQSIPILFTAVS